MVLIATNTAAFPLLQKGKTVTVTYTIRYNGDKHNTIKTARGKILTLTPTSVELRAKPIAGLSSNVTQMIGVRSIREVAA